MIFYFTGTGNTRWVAEQIAEAIGEELLFIPDLIREGRYEFELQEGERIGFCFPTHGWQPPRIVREFVSQMKIREFGNSEERRPYCWALTTCGDNMGEAMTIFNKELFPLQAKTQFAVVMPESNVCFSFLHLDTPEKERQKIEAARARLPHIIDVIKDRQEGVVELVKGAIPRTYSYVIGGYYNKHLIKDDKLWVDEDACIGCVLCSRLCPVDDIEGTPPRWKHNGQCTNCLACYHHCPKHAIHWGKMKRDQYYFNRRGDRR
jgi:NAD-dependent dihydropyrimidine dehydrogenase PreA subunit